VALNVEPRKVGAHGELVQNGSDGNIDYNLLKLTSELIKELNDIVRPAHASAHLHMMRVVDTRAVETFGCCREANRPFAMAV
jgi:hypothetical protein